MNASGVGSLIRAGARQQKCIWVAIDEQPSLRLGVRLSSVGISGPGLAPPIPEVSKSLCRNGAGCVTFEDIERLSSYRPCGLLSHLAGGHTAHGCCSRAKASRHLHLYAHVFIVGKIFEFPSHAR